jgi:hypothetical protein
MGIAEFIIGRAFARPVGSTDLMDSVNGASFLLCCCPVVANTVIRIAEMADVAIHFRDRGARNQKKLLPHFGKAGTAVFAVEEIKDGGHDRPPSFDRRHTTISLRVHCVI